jgi:hypothetical protein
MHHPDLSPLYREEVNFKRLFIPILQPLFLSTTPIPDRISYSSSPLCAFQVPGFLVSVVRSSLPVVEAFEYASAYSEVASALPGLQK